MTTDELRQLRQLLGRFSSDYHSFNPPHELSETEKMVADTLEEQSKEEAMLNEG